MKKILCLFLVTVLLVSAVACSGTQNGGQTASGKNETSGEGTAAGEKGSADLYAEYGGTDGVKLPIVDRPIKITFFEEEHPSTPFNKDWIPFQILKEATNIEYDFMLVPASSVEQKLQLLASTNELPDLIYSKLVYANKYGPEGMLAKVNEYLDSMPSYKKFLDENPNIKKQLTLSGDNMYFLPITGWPKYSYVWLYRSDVFAKNNITPPENTDQLYDALKQLKSKYPDTYPFISRRGIKDLFKISALQWNTGYGMYYDDKSDTWKFGTTEDNFKALLMYFNKLYKERLLDPEWATLATKQWEDKLVNSKGFVTIDWIHRIDMMKTPGTNVDPDFKLAMLKPVIQEGLGERKLPTGEYDESHPGFLVSEKSKYKAEIFKMFGFMYSPAGEVLLNYGKLGDTCKKNEDGTFTFTEKVRTPANPNAGEPFDAFFGFNQLGTYAKYSPTLDNVIYPSQEINAAFKEMAENKYTIDPYPVLLFTGDERKQLAELEANISDLSDEKIGDFVINGDFSKWDAFVKDVKKLKADELVKLYNDVYKR